jgi:hypothetical protein
MSSCLISSRSRRASSPLGRLIQVVSASIGTARRPELLRIGELSGVVGRNCLGLELFPEQRQLPSFIRPARISKRARNLQDKQKWERPLCGIAPISSFPLLRFHQGWPKCGQMACSAFSTPFISLWMSLA